MRHLLVCGALALVMGGLLSSCALYEGERISSATKSPEVMMHHDTNGNYDYDYIAVYYLDEQLFSLISENDWENIVGQRHVVKLGIRSSEVFPTMTYQEYTYQFNGLYIEFNKKHVPNVLLSKEYNIAQDYNIDVLRLDEARLPPELLDQASLFSRLSVQNVPDAVNRFVVESEQGILSITFQDGRVANMALVATYPI